MYCEVHPLRVDVFDIEVEGMVAMTKVGFTGNGEEIEDSHQVEVQVAGSSSAISNHVDVSLVDVVSKTRLLHEQRVLGHIQELLQLLNFPSLGSILVDVNTSMELGCDKINVISEYIVVVDDPFSVQTSAPEIFELRLGEVFSQTSMSKGLNYPLEDMLDGDLFEVVLLSEEDASVDCRLFGVEVDEHLLCHDSLS